MLTKNIRLIFLDELRLVKLLYTNSNLAPKVSCPHSLKRAALCKFKPQVALTLGRITLFIMPHHFFDSHSHVHLPMGSRSEK